MSRTVQCDKCRAKKSEKAQGWSGVYLSGDIRSHGFDTLSLDVDLCPKCSMRVLPMISKLINKK